MADEKQIHVICFLSFGICDFRCTRVNFIVGILIPDRRSSPEICSFPDSRFHQYLKKGQVAVLQGIVQGRHSHIVFGIDIGAIFN